ncbi:MAG: type II secretion system minor pseudopilin [Thermodesulfovibrionales bacterium]
MSRNFSHLRNDQGIALLLVLWVLMALMVMALSFTYLTRTEALGALSFRQTIERKFLAEAGVERAVMEILYRRLTQGAKVFQEDREVWRTDGTPYRTETGNGYFSVRIIDEGGKVDINRTPDVILRNLLRNRGLKQDDADMIVDAIMDWRDADDLHRINGAESDYYMSLPNPYKARNADFETLEELLLVKGVTAEILYGGAGTKGLFDLLTINSRTGKVNLNSAPREVLMAVPGMSAEDADAIMANRDAQPPLNIMTLVGKNYSVFAPFVDLADSTAFSIESSGHRPADKTGYAIRATIALEANGKFRYLYYKSPVTIDNASDTSN